MEKIIFLGLVIPILVFILYLGGSAIMSGFSAKEANRKIKQEDEDNRATPENNDQLANELIKIEKLRQSNVLTQEEFEKAKKKILEN